MKSLSFWFIMLASLFALAGMAFGIWMSASQDHTLSGAHAHNNLIGFVTMALFGVYYRLVPAAATTRLAMIHFWVSLVGAILFPIGVGMAILNMGPMLAQLSSILVILSMLIFAWTVFANRSALTAA
jgi:cbb3-type cytochrome oxidase subunit 1